MPFDGTAEVVTARAYIHEDGRRVSFFTSYVPDGFILTETGFDIYWTGDGTVGRCKPAFATEAEAIAYAKDWNDKRAAAYAAHAAQQAPAIARKRSKRT